MLFLPVALHQIVACDAGLAGKDRNDFVRALPAIKRLDQRLNNTDRPVVSARIAPRLKIMRLGNMPLAKFSGLVSMRAQKYFQTDGARFQRRGEFKFSRRVVCRIAAENQQQVDFSGAHVLDERMQRLVATYRICIDWLGIENRPADVADRLINGVRESVNSGWLMIANDHNAGSVV